MTFIHSLVGYSTTNLHFRSIFSSFFFHFCMAPFFRYIIKRSCMLFCFFFLILFFVICFSVNTESNTRQKPYYYCTFSRFVFLTIIFLFLTSTSSLFNSFLSHFYGSFFPPHLFIRLFVSL